MKREILSMHIEYMFWNILETAQMEDTDFTDFSDFAAKVSWMFFFYIS